MSSVKMLLGKKALVTGAGKGIGRSIALAYAESGAELCIVSRTAEDIEKLAEEIKSKFGTKATPIVANLSNRKGAEDAIKKSQSTMKRIDVLICAAGYPLVLDIWERKMQDLDERQLLDIFQVDVLGSFRMVKGVLPGMMNQRSGVIVLFSSTPAISGYHKGGAYTVAKAANLGLVKELASEYGEYNIRVYAIAPGNIKTDRTFDQLSREDQQKLSEESPMKRWGDPSEVAQVAVILASDMMSFVTGQTIVVDGGTVML